MMNSPLTVRVSQRSPLVVSPVSSKFPRVSMVALGACAKAGFFMVLLLYQWTDDQPLQSLVEVTRVPIQTDLSLPNPNTATSPVGSATGLTWLPMIFGPRFFHAPHAPALDFFSANTACAASIAKTKMSPPVDATAETSEFADPPRLVHPDHVSPVSVPDQIALSHPRTKA